MYAEKMALTNIGYDRRVQKESVIQWILMCSDLTLISLYTQLCCILYELQLRTEVSDTGDKSAVRCYMRHICANVYVC